LTKKNFTSNLDFFSNLFFCFLFFGNFFVKTKEKLISILNFCFLFFTLPSTFVLQKEVEVNLKFLFFVFYFTFNFCFAKRKRS